MQEFYLSVLTIAGFYAILALSLQITWGQMGVANLGIAGFFGIGGYVSAFLSIKFGLPLAATMFLGAGVSAAIGMFFSRLTSNLQEDYLAIANLGLAEILRLICVNEIWLTNGVDGISGVPSPFDRADGERFAILYGVLLVVATMLVWLLAVRILRAPIGRLLRAIRDDDVSIEAGGKNVALMRDKIFALGAFVAGLGGGLYVHYFSYVSPDIFRPLLTVYVFLSLTLGGRTSPTGGVVGAVLVVALVEALRFIVPMIPGINGVQDAAIREIIIALVFIFALIRFPHGLLGKKIDGMQRG